MDVFEELIVFVEIVVWLVKLRCQDHADGSCREVIEGTPYLRVDEQPFGWVVEQVGLGFCSVVEGNREGAADGNEHLSQSLVGMTASASALWHFVYPVGTLQVEGEFDIFLRHRQVASWVRYGM